jgi:hypothetical protein
MEFALWTPLSILRARPALPFYTLRVAIPEMALRSFQGRPPTGWTGNNRLTIPLDTPCRTGLILRYTCRRR